MHRVIRQIVGRSTSRSNRSTGGRSPAQTRRVTATSISRLCSLLAASLNLVRQFQALHHLAPERGSQAWNELQQEDSFRMWGEQPIATAHSVAAAYFTAASDHLRSLQILASDDTQAMGALVVARSALEAAARAWWLFDPAIDVGERTARGLNEKLLSLQRQLQFPDETRTREDGDEQTRRIVAGAEAYGVKVRRRKKSEELLGIGAAPPSATEVVDALIRSALGKAVGGHVYRYYSALAHPTAYGILDHLRLEPDARTPMGLRYGRLMRREDAIESALIFALLAYHELLGRVVALYGWDRKIFEGWSRYSFSVFAQVVKRPDAARGSAAGAATSR